MALRRFNTYGTVQLDGAGAGSVRLPVSGVWWQIDLMSVSVNSSVKMPTALVTNNSEFVEGSYSGALDSSDTIHYVGPTDRLVCTWSGGDANATATFRVTGWQANSMEEFSRAV